ncbi:MAG: SGNH/GDSL hydrolase family protein [Ilumatobacteraceae bacterium]
MKYLNLPAGVSEACATWVAELPAVLANFDPEVVLVTGGLADLSERQLPDGTWAHIGEPAFDEWLLGQMNAMATLVTGRARLAWATHPHVAVEPNPLFTGQPPFAENDPGRADRYNELIEQTAASRDDIHVVHFAEFLQARPGGEFADGLRTDGIHLDTRLFPDVVAFLVGELEAAAGH